METQKPISEVGYVKMKTETYVVKINTIHQNCTKLGKLLLLLENTKATYASNPWGLKEYASYL